MLILIVGLVLFLGMHSANMVAPGLRERVISGGGARKWRLSYTVLSTVGLVLIVVGYGLARQNPVVVYTPPLALRHLTLLVMLPVFPLFASAHRPGYIRAAVRHPMFLGTVLWGTAHLLANGTLADILLFGGFAGWAGLDWLTTAQRNGEKTNSGRPASLRSDVIAVVAGLVIYAIFVGGLHQLLFGVSPIL